MEYLDNIPSVLLYNTIYESCHGESFNTLNQIYLKSNDETQQ